VTAVRMAFRGLSRRLHQHATADARVLQPNIRLSTIVLREATVDDVGALQALIADHVAEGHLLPRTREELTVHATRFVVATDGQRIVGCADLAPLGPAVGEIRSLVIGEEARGLGIGRRLMTRLIDRAASAGFSTLCAFTSAPGFFVQSGFSIVPHAWLPAKIAADCHSCSRFRSCGQYAVMLPLPTIGR
jgi:amino-acid N-acetyltransferase